jgi:hypothetical protein
MPAGVRSRILYWLVRKFARTCTFRHLGRQCCGISRLEAVSAIFIIRIDGYYAFDCHGAGCPTLDFRTKWSQHQRRLHLRNIGAKDAAKNDEPKHRSQFANWMQLQFLSQLYQGANVPCSLHKIPCSCDFIGFLHFEPLQNDRTSDRSHLRSSIERPVPVLKFPFFSPRGPPGLTHRAADIACGHVWPHER